MANYKIFRCAILIAAALALLGTFCFFYHQEQSMCMGVKILSEKEYSILQYGAPENVDSLIFQDSVPVAMDTESATIYVSQDIDETTYLAELSGILNITNGGYSLAFAPDDSFSDLFSAMGEGHRFKLLVTKTGVCCKEYQVIFTNLPVLRLSGTGDIFTESGASGMVVVWTPIDPDTGKYSVKTSDAQWHIRGASSQGLAKKSLKLNIRDESGNKRNMTLCGLGEDDDWILNAMATDDLKIREATVGSVWQKIQETSVSPQKMSYGMYVEVISNDNYQGIYLLQRRIDEKYLELKSNHILCKGWTYAPPKDSIFEVKHCIYSTDLQQKLAIEYYEHRDPEHIQLDNWIDVNILVQACCLPDNAGLKNMYYLWTIHQENYTLSLIPWDTDMAFGYGWDNRTGVTYVPDEYPSDCQINRSEYLALQNIYTNLETMIADRWTQLRDSGLSAEYVLASVESHKNQLIDSGAYNRDIERWGIRNNNADTFEKLYVYIDERFMALDSYYEYSPCCE